MITKKSEANLVIFTLQSSPIFLVQLPKGFFCLWLLVTSVKCLTVDLLCHFLLKHSTFSQFEDSNLLILGKSSLNNTFTSFVPLYWFTPITCMLSFLISHYYHFSLIPFILLPPFYFAFSFMASVSWPVFSSIYSYSFLC